MPVQSQDRLSEAKKAMALYNFSRAVALLLPDTAHGSLLARQQTALLLADCYRFMNEPGRSAKWYGAAFASQPGRVFTAAHAGDVLHYAMMLRTCGDYHQARQVFLRYDSLRPADQTGRTLAAWCDSALAWQTAKPVFRVTNVEGINSPQSDFGAVVNGDSLLFASDRVPGGTAIPVYGWTGNTYLRLYLASCRGGVSPRLVTWWTDDENAPWHIGPACLSHDGSRVFVTRTLADREKGKKEPGRINTHLLKIFTAEKSDGRWSPLEAHYLNNPQYSVGHPALSVSGDSLFFASDMPGGMGETDIYLCRRVNGKWEYPVNLGPGINTPGKEMFPYITPGGDLCFASDGHPGFGGLDLYIARRNGDSWGRPVNPGIPLNSPGDDFSLFTVDADSGGYFSSNRPGGKGSDDIYRFERIKTPASLPIPPAETVSAGRILADTLVPGKAYRIDNIFYDFDKWNIRDDARPALDRLVVLMRENPFSIELGSHTDCRGSDEYNLVLSGRRAESAVTYIISKGIDPSRIKAKGYGESQPATKCGCAKGRECTEQEHQYNRRTEFKIITDY